MSKATKTYEEKIASKDEQIQQLLNQKKQLRQKQNAAERKERNSRLCRRHGLLEKYLSDLIILTDEQFDMFIKRGIRTKYGVKVLYDILGLPIPKELAVELGIEQISGNGGNTKPPKAEQFEA